MLTSEIRLACLQLASEYNQTAPASNIVWTAGKFAAFIDANGKDSELAFSCLKLANYRNERPEHEVIARAQAYLDAVLGKDAAS